MTVLFSDLTSRFESNGLTWLGSFAIGENDRPFPERTVQPKRIAIIGNVGSLIWPVFESARQERPDLTLDQWTEGVIDRIASDFSLEAVYPFKGPPYHPFIRWAQRTGVLFASPIGLTIHPTFGLWLAFRAALLIDQDLEEPETTAEHPCESCQDRPCLSSCPVGAFTAEGYQFDACLDHVASPGNVCSHGGCLARIACPVGQAYRYRQPHAAFHMHELLRSHGKV